jgi:hypothetical protein
LAEAIAPGGGRQVHMPNINKRPRTSRTTNRENVLRVRVARCIARLVPNQWPAPLSRERIIKSRGSGEGAGGWKYYTVNVNTSALSRV